MNLETEFNLSLEGCGFKMTKAGLLAHGDHLARLPIGFGLNESRQWLASLSFAEYSCGAAPGFHGIPF